MRAIRTAGKRLAGVGLALAAMSVMPAMPATAAAPQAGVPPAAAPDKIERGRYLAHHVTSCIDCHSERNWTYHAGPVVPGTEGKGNKLDYLRLDRYAPNITPAALGSWSDAELLLAITQGVDRQGRAVHSFLPAEGFGRLAKEDADSLVAYIRTLKPIESASPRPSTPAPKMTPRPYKPKPAPAAADTVAYGQYLVAVANCRFCHGEELTGGKEFQIPGRPPVASLNITPFQGTAAAKERASFIGQFKAYASDGARRLRAPQEKPSSVMPWTDLARMTEQDLGAIYDYLRTQPAKPPAKIQAAKP